MADMRSEHKKADDTSTTSRLAVKVAEKADKLKYIIIAVVVILLVAAGVFSYVRRSRAEKTAAADTAFFTAELEQGQNPGEGIQIFGKMAQDYAGLPAGARAQIVQFAQAFNTREFATAETAARNFISRYPDSIFTPRARLALAQTVLEMDRVSEAVNMLRELTSVRTPDIYPEAKLALAQALEREAEQVKDSDPAEYRRRLEVAAEEYADIVGQSQSPTGRGFWSQAVVLPADFSLVLVRDKLAGYEHPAPLGRAESAASALPATIDMSDFPPPAADPVEALREEAEARALEAVNAAMEALGVTPSGDAAAPVEVPDSFIPNPETESAVPTETPAVEPEAEVEAVDAPPSVEPETDATDEQAAEISADEE
ncbi:MAG: tetratricopeptide repeat protein [Planctomycetes bacterium]|nr:tetratricopeptide repeat protein [Planctomycetota bacterium]